MARPRGPLSDTESTVLRILWEHGPGTVREVNEHLSHWAYTTVQTLLTRLVKKGYAACDRTGFAHLFRPLVTRDELLRERACELVDRWAEGIAAPLVLALVEEHRLSQTEIQQLRRVLDRLDEEARSAAHDQRETNGHNSQP